jgi:hypothetical protein
MKYLPVIFAVLAVSFILAEGWCGPVYTMSDWCQCHRSRAWLEFDESLNLRGMKLFLRVEEPGDPQHQHQFCDPQYGGQYPVLAYIGVGFGLLSAATWLYRRRALPDLRYDHVA